MIIEKVDKKDFTVILELMKFISSLNLDIEKKVGKAKLLEIVEYCFQSEEDRFSYRNCNVYKENDEILGFYFSYHYNDVNNMKEFWYKNTVNKFDLLETDIIFDYDEVFPNEYYLDTLYVLEDFRGKSIGGKLLEHFIKQNNYIKSLNVAQYNKGAEKLYKSLGFKKNNEIIIAGEKYNHMIKI